MSKAAFTFEIAGVKEMMRFFDELPTVSMQKTVLRNALMKAGQPIAQEAIRNVPSHKSRFLGNRRVGTLGRLARSIKVSTSLKASQKKGKVSDRSRVTVYVGSTAPHAHLVEFGTVVRHTKKGKSTGRMTPNPFLTRAWEATKSTALHIFAAEMKEQIIKAARRLAKRASKGKLTASQIRGLSR